MSERPRRWGRLVLAVLILAGAGYWGWRRLHSSGPPISAPCADCDAPAPDASAPRGTRVKVEVINATTTRGLARRATLFLRERGFDVVGTGTDRGQRDSTLVLDRSGHPDWAARVAKSLGARSESRPDSSRYVDVTVLLGRDWRPSGLPFHP